MTARLIGLVVLGFLGGAAQAQQYVADVDCMSDGCLSSGWVVHNWDGPGTVIVECLDHDCVQMGWTEEIVGRGGQARAICEEGGCLNRGFSTVDPWGRLLGRTQCLAGTPGTAQCLTGGWVSENGFDQVTVRCRNSNCGESGWTMRGPNTWREARCKPGGCFQEGWWVRNL